MKPKTPEEIKAEINNLISIRNRFQPEAALYSEITTILIALRWTMSEEKIPQPSTHIQNFLQLKENQRVSEGNLIITPRGFDS